MCFYFRKFLVFFYLITISFFTANAQTLHPITFDDLVKVGRVSDSTPSPDGKWIAYTISTPDKEANRLNSDIWIVSTTNGETRQLTNSKKSDSEPRWSPDSQSIAFVSDRDGSAQIWILSLKGGEPHKLTNFFTDVSGLLWSPDGKWMAFTSEVYPECSSDECNKKKFDLAESSKVKAKIADSLFYRHWASWREGRSNHIFVVSSTGGQVKDLTPGNYDAPSIGVDSNGYAFSPDGSELAFVTKTDKVPANSTNNDIFIVSTNGGESKRISTSPGSDLNPKYSPDGKYIAWTSMARAGFESDRQELVLYDRVSKQIRSITKSLDLSVAEFSWAPDSRRLYFCAEQKGQIPIFIITINGNDAKPLFSEGTNSELSVSADGTKLFFSHNSLVKPSEIYSMKIVIDGKEVSQLTHTNDRLLSSIKFGKVEDFWFEGAANTKVHGWLIKPPQFKNGKKYPVVFLIHGGPQGAWHNDWSYRWNPEIFAAQGYVVALINQRGSTGYGQQFTDEVSGDWGGKPYEDLMKGVDYVSKFDYVDATRMGAAGASYGGYMVNWLLGHTDRFKVLVSHAGIFNLESDYYSTEEMWFPNWEFKGSPTENPELYAKWSPHRFVKNFKTPTLVTHGELDYRVSVMGGIELFTALQMQGVPSRLLYFPDEGHWILKPQNSELWHHTVMSWLAKYLKP